MRMHSVQIYRFLFQALAFGFIRFQADAFGMTIEALQREELDSMAGHGAGQELQW